MPSLLQRVSYRPLAFAVVLIALLFSTADRRVDALVALGLAGCRREPAQPRSLMVLDDERRESLRPTGQPAPLPDEPRPAQWGGSGAAIGMQVDAMPAAAKPASEKPAPIPAEPSPAPILN